MDAYNFNPNDPRVQAMLAQMRAQQGGGMMAGAAMPPGGQMPPQAAPAVQAPLQNGAQPMPPQAGPAQLDPSMVDAVIGMQGQGTQRANLDRQMKLADALRANAGKQLQSTTVPTSTGGMTVAPSWLNGAVAVGQSLMADKRQRDAEKAGAGLDKERQAAQRGYFDALTGQKKKRDPNDDLGGFGSLSDL